MVYISRLKTENATWEITASELGITGISRNHSFVAAKENAHTRLAAEELEAYFAGRVRTFSVPLDLQGTEFQKQVWQALREIPYGTSVCYSQIAQKIGRPKAVRAAAQAIGHNPCLILVPCHRVLGKKGALTGFSAGLDLKEQLLQLEGIPYLA